MRSVPFDMCGHEDREYADAQMVQWRAWSAKRKAVRLGLETEAKPKPQPWERVPTVCCVCGDSIEITADQLERNKKANRGCYCKQCIYHKISMATRGVKKNVRY